MSSVHQARFQLFSPLPEDKYQALKADIQANGVLVPVEIDQNGQVLDGHHRIRAWKELRAEGVQLSDYPRVIRSFDNDDDREEHAAKINCNRRDVSLEDKQRVALAWRQRGWSYRRIADALGVSHMTAHRWIPDEDATVTGVTVDLPERIVGKDGKSRPATMPKPKPTVFATSEKEQERALTALDSLVPHEDDDHEVIAPVNLNTGEILTATSLQRMAKESKRQSVRDANQQLVQGVTPIQEYTQGQRFKTVVIDPPWDWGDEGDIDQFGRGRPTYETMSIEQLSEMPIGEIADTNAHLYLWITNRSLPKGFQLMERWGFRYVTMLTWCKPSIGMGNYFRGSTEHMLFGVRGSLPLIERNIGTWFEAKRGTQHSSKPDEAYELIERASPGPWIDVFSRRDRKGWVTWGEQAVAS